MSFGKANEVTDGNRKLYTGVENFQVVKVCPSKTELETMFGREISYTPEYIGEQNVNDGDGERKAKQVRIDFFVNNDDAETPIAIKVSFYIIDTHHKSQTGKIRVINNYGKTTWLTPEDIKNKTVPGNMQWYKTDGLKVAKRGEEELIEFIANLLNLPFDPAKAKDPKDAHAVFSPERWAEIFSGDFSYLNEIVESTNNKVGLALGVKVSDDQSLRQVAYNRKTLRQFTKSSNKADKFKWLNDSIQNAKDNGAYGTTDFGAVNYALTEYSFEPTTMDKSNMPEADNGDIFSAIESTSDEVPDTNKAEDWMN